MSRIELFGQPPINLENNPDEMSLTDMSNFCKESGVDIIFCYEPNHDSLAIIMINQVIQKQIRFLIADEWLAANKADGGGLRDTLERLVELLETGGEEVN